MLKKEYEKLRALFKANPILTTENSQAKMIIQQSLKAVIDDIYFDSTEEERIQVYSETLLEIENIIKEISLVGPTLN
mgnify:CR=1 FL=1